MKSTTQIARSEAAEALHRCHGRDSTDVVMTNAHFSNASSETLYLNSELSALHPKPPKTGAVLVLIRE